MPDIAMGVLSRNGTVLLARRSSERKVHPDRWSLPGGHIEEGEDAETAMCRELMEEIGVTPEFWQFAGRFGSEGPPKHPPPSMSITSIDGTAGRDLSVMNTPSSDGSPPPR